MVDWISMKKSGAFDPCWTHSVWPPQAFILPLKIEVRAGHQVERARVRDWPCSRTWSRARCSRRQGAEFARFYESNSAVTLFPLSVWPEGISPQAAQKNRSIFVT